MIANDKSVNKALRDRYFHTWRNKVKEFLTHNHAKLGDKPTSPDDYRGITEDDWYALKGAIDQIYTDLNRPGLTMDDLKLIKQHLS